MYFSCSEAAQRLGVTERQVQRAAASGRLEAQRVGKRFILHERTLHVFQHTVRRGRRWSKQSIADALNLLTGKETVTTGSSRSRLKTKIRSLEVGDLAGILLQRKEVSIHRANPAQASEIPSAVESEAGLGGGGIRVIAEHDARKAALKRRLPIDIEGNVIAVTSEREHAQAIEAAVLAIYGSTRERTAGESVLTKLQESV
nr:excisionase family DNA-binding protein [Leucobacter exalbidus]